MTGGNRKCWLWDGFKVELETVDEIWISKSDGLWPISMASKLPFLINAVQDRWNKVCQVGYAMLCCGNK